VRRQFWDQVRAGLSVVEAAESVGVSRCAGKRWFQQVYDVFMGLHRIAAS
jgi:transposase